MCSHPAFYGNLCVGCGMKFSNEDVETNKKIIVGGGKSLRYNSTEAERVSQDKMLSLKNSKRIALVLDLDHTLLHSIQVDGPSPTSNVSDCVNGLYHLPVEEIVGSAVKHLVMKKRPYLDSFLKEVSSFCQMTIYTAGTRRYAEAIQKIIDPDRKYFSDRIVSRSDVAGGAEAKSLDRIFIGESSKLAVIIDDREDVWSTKDSKHSQVDHLLLVRPYIYFSGPNIIEANNSSGHTGALNPVISLCNAGSIVTTAPQFSDAFSEADDQLKRCADVLNKIHGTYYQSVYSKSVASIITDMKFTVLSGCTITFSGIIPVNDPSPRSHLLWRLAESLGAQVHNMI